MTPSEVLAILAFVVEAPGIAATVLAICTVYKSNDMQSSRGQEKQVPNESGGQDHARARGTRIGYEECKECKACLM